MLAKRWLLVARLLGKLKMVFLFSPRGANRQWTTALHSGNCLSTYKTLKKVSKIPSGHSITKKVKNLLEQMTKVAPFHLSKSGLIPQPT